MENLKQVVNSLTNRVRSLRSESWIMIQDRNQLTEIANLHTCYRGWTRFDRCIAARSDGTGVERLEDENERGDGMLKRF